MSDPTELGKRLADLRSDKGLSALELSKRAGLSINYVRSIERGLRRPQPGPFAAVLDALGVPPETAAELKWLAGIVDDPSDSPAARAARAEAWSPLLYILVNHILLPRGEFDPSPKTRGRSGEAQRELLTSAASAKTLLAFATERLPEGKPPAVVLSLIEQKLPLVPASTAGYLCSLVREVGRDGLFYDFHERHVIAACLAPLRRPRVPEHEAWSRVMHFGFDRNFALCMFPIVYWHTCSHWPFQKVQMPFSRSKTDVQRLLFDAVRSGASLEDLDLALLGQGQLGEAVSRHLPARPSPEECIGHDDGTPPTPDRFQFEMNDGERRIKHHAPRPPTDGMFDHLDRCDFLERFPLIKLDQEGFADLARSKTLPSWTAWVRHIRKHRVGWPTSGPPWSESRFASVLEPWPSTEMLTVSHTARMIAARFSEAVERGLMDGLWNSLDEAGAMLAVDPAWAAIISAFADAPPAPNAPDRVSK